MTNKFLPRSPRDVIDLVRSQPLAWIVSGAPGNVHATVLPVQLECDDAGTPARIVGHFGRNNAQWRALRQDGRATVLLLGPHGYVSPSWFADRTQAPTWNYASAWFDIDVTIRDTPTDADIALRGLVDDMEGSLPNAWSPSEMGERYNRLAVGVVGFDASVIAAHSRFKLGQDERPDVFDDILRGLDLHGDADLARWMRTFAGKPVAEERKLAQPAPVPLDPEIMTFIDAVRATGRALTAGRKLDWPARRAIAEQSRLPWQEGGPQMHRIDERCVDTGAGPVRLRFYHPAAGDKLPALVYMHGGGWALFSIDTHDRLMREYAARSGMVVIGVDYALAPEARYPVALNQVVGVVRWLRAHGDDVGIDRDRLALGGDSAGGSLSMGAVLKLRDAGEGDAVKAVLSIYGGFSPDCSPASLQRYGTEDDMLTAAEIGEFWNNYIGRQADRRDPYLVPVLAKVHGLPPCFLVVAECDVLAEQNLLMAGMLLEAGNNVKVKVYSGAPHSFIEAMAVSRVASDAIDDGARWLRAIMQSTITKDPHA